MTAALHDWQEPFHQPRPPKGESIEAIILPLDGSAVAKSALPVAHIFAKLYGATLHVVYVGDESMGPRETLAELGLDADDIRGAVLDCATGDPAEAITAIATSRPGSLLIMSTHTASPSESLLGAVAEAVLVATPTRIVLVPPERGEGWWRIGRVLLAHDGTPSADAATAPAADVAHRAGAEVIAMHVAARTSPQEVEPGSLPAPRYVDQPQHEWPSWANEFLDRMMALGAPPAMVNFKLLVTGGQPGSEVADFARDNHADLVVTTWHGRWDEERAGTLKVIIRRAGCPVLLVYSPQLESV